MDMMHMHKAEGVRSILKVVEATAVYVEAYCS